MPFPPSTSGEATCRIRIAKISDRFPHLCWGLWDGHELEGWGEGIHLIDDWGYLDSPEPRLSFYRWARHIPLAAKAGRIYHFQLGGTDQ